MRITLTQSLIKTATFAAIHFSVAFSVGYALTGNVGLASAIALIEPAANTIAYFLHERVWLAFTRPGPAQPASPKWQAP